MLWRAVLLGNFGYWLSCLYYFDTYHSPKYSADAHMETTFPACSGLLQQDCVSFLPPQTTKKPHRCWPVLWILQVPIWSSMKAVGLKGSSANFPAPDGRVHAHQRSELFWQNKEDVTLGLGDILFIYVSWTTVSSSFFLTDSGIWQLLTYQQKFQPVYNN